MPVKYAAIFVGDERVAEHPPGQYADYASICQKLADKVSKINKYNRTQLKDDQQGVDISYLATGRNVLIACVSTQDVAMRIAFDMLGRVDAKCKGERVDWPLPAETLKKEMAFANDPNNDMATKVMGEIRDIEGIMLENMDKLVERGDKIDDIVVKSDKLASEGQTFFQRGRTLRRKMWCQQAKMTFMLVAVVLVVVMIIVFVICKPNFSDCS